MATTSVSTESSERLLKQTAAWCGLNGLMYTDGVIAWTLAPITILPNIFPRGSFEYAEEVQPIVNKLIDRIARDREFMLSHLSSVSDSDEFTMKLMELYKKVPNAVLSKGLQFGILRSDYMIHNDGSPLQVEINTIASSFGFLSKRVSKFHQFILARNAGRKEMNILIDETFDNRLDKTQQVVADNIHQNPSNVELARGIARAHQAYNDPNAVVLFIVQPGERNVADQRAFEAELWNEHQVPVEFVTLKDIAERGRLLPASITTSTSTSTSTGPSVDGNAGLPTLAMRPLSDISVSGEADAEVPVSVAYFRAGYGPGDYPTDLEWEARSLLESSNAIKCPNVGYQLAGTKAIQAALCLPHVLEKFLTERESDLVRKCFATQYSLANETIAEVAQQAVKKAIVDGSEWVLKPQREGGGNNLYGAELSQFLKTHENDPILQGYVLMQRIFPMPQKSAFLRKGVLAVLPSISELGIYGTYLSYGDDKEDNSVVKDPAGGGGVPGAGAGAGGGGVPGVGVGVGEGEGVSSPVLLNQYAGYLLRTKPDGVDEGGVASGYSVLSSVILE